VFCLACIGCEQEESDPIVANPAITGNLVSVDGCKSGFTKSVADRNMGCIQFHYDAAAQKLTLVHINAGFNCCPEEIKAEVAVEKGVIRITESQRGANCRCDCLFDLNILVENVPAASFTVVVDEPLRNEKDTPIEFSIDLSKEVEGEHCVPRNFYPWGG
jgi:hypothetical protein